jgi:hypothetical protein
VKKIKFPGTRDKEYEKVKEKLMTCEEEINGTDFKINQEGILKFNNIIYLPNSINLKLLIFNEIHKNPYSGHPRY